ncbi:MAG TPA: mechanosensitive ion channel family protein [Steroidobacteraceae bacterium]
MNLSNWSQIAHQILLDNSPSAWLYAVSAFLLSFSILPLVRGFLRARRRARYAHREMPLAAALIGHLAEHTSRVVLWIVALYLAENILTLPKRVDMVFSIAIVIGIWLQLGLWAVASSRFAVHRHEDRGSDTRLSGTMDVVLFVAAMVIWVVVALLAMENLGINVGPLIAGLGVGGIAIALAVQAILGDLFASLSIALDKPFVVGDSLRVDGFEGTVEQIGIKSTRLRSITGEQIIIANADLLKSRVRNLGRASERRVLFTLALAYNTPVEKLQRVPKIVTEAVASYAGTRYVHCMLRELGESALLFEVCFFVENTPRRNVSEALDQVNLQILQGFAQAGIEFAYPTRTLLLREPLRDPDPSG